MRWSCGSARRARAAGAARIKEILGWSHHVPYLFGVASRTSKRVSRVQLDGGAAGIRSTRIDDEFYEALGLRIPMIRMPVAPGRNVAILVEVAARNQLLRTRGHHAARRLVDRLTRELDPASRTAEIDPDHGEDL